MVRVHVFPIQFRNEKNCRHFINKFHFSFRNNEFKFSVWNLHEIELTERCWWKEIFLLPLFVCLVALNIERERKKKCATEIQSALTLFVFVFISLVSVVVDQFSTSLLFRHEDTVKVRKQKNKNKNCHEEWSEDKKEK